MKFAWSQSRDAISFPMRDTFVCRVVGTTTRGGKRWMHWDAGLFGGVIETTGGLKYKIRSDRSGPGLLPGMSRGRLAIPSTSCCATSRCPPTSGGRLHLHP
jgi:hypothetical protein